MYQQRPDVYVFCFQMFDIASMSHMYLCVGVYIPVVRNTDLGTAGLD